MSKIGNRIKVPEEFKSLKQMVLKDVNNNDDSLEMSPKGYNLSTKESNEKILLIIRTPLKKYLPRMVVGLLLSVFFPIVIYWPISRLEGSITFLIGMIIASIMFVSAFFLYSFLKWYYDLGIITDKRVIDLDFHGVISHSMAETKLENIVDVIHKQVGIKANLSDVGDLYIKTGGDNAEIIFRKIKKPRAVQNMINKLLEEKKKGKI